jgi:DNA-binding HxlR family transcriptional regulator
VTIKDKANPNPYKASCPTRLVLDRIANKWTVLVLGLLVDRPMRFNQLRHKIEGISQKMLTQTLRNLERDGLVKRQVFATVPVTVEYSVTPLGRTLTNTVDALREWADMHIKEVLLAQTDYDTKRDDNTDRLAVN